MCFECKIESCIRSKSDGTIKVLKLVNHEVTNKNEIYFSFYFDYVYGSKLDLNNQPFVSILPIYENNNIIIKEGYHGYLLDSLKNFKINNNSFKHKNDELPWHCMKGHELWECVIPVGISYYLNSFNNQIVCNNLKFVKKIKKF